MTPDEDFVSLEELMKGMAETLTPDQREGAYAFAALLGALTNDDDSRFLSLVDRAKQAEVWEVCLIRFSHYAAPLLSDKGDNAIEIAHYVVNHRERPQRHLGAV